MPRMGKTEEDWNGLKLGFLKTVQPNSFSKLISAVCNFKNNAQETYLFVLNLWFCHLHVISLLTHDSNDNLKNAVAMKFLYGEPVGLILAHTKLPMIQNYANWLAWVNLWAWIYKLNNQRKITHRTQKNPRKSDFDWKHAREEALWRSGTTSLWRALPSLAFVT